MPARPRPSRCATFAALLLGFAAACGSPEGAQADEDARLPADREAASPDAPAQAVAADTIRVRKEAVVSDSARIDPRLREVMASRPDSVVAVLLRLRDPEQADTTALRAAGLDVGVTVGRVMTGRIRARELPALSAVPGVLSIDEAERIEVPRPPDADVRPNSNDSR